MGFFSKTFFFFLKAKEWRRSKGAKKRVFEKKKGSERKRKGGEEAGQSVLRTVLKRAGKLSTLNSTSLGKAERMCFFIC